MGFFRHGIQPFRHTVTAAHEIAFVHRRAGIAARHCGQVKMLQFIFERPCTITQMIQRSPDLDHDDLRLVNAHLFNGIMIGM